MINISINNKIRKIIIAVLILAIVSIIAFCVIYQKEREINGMKPVAEIRITSEEMKDRRLLWEDGYVAALVHIEADGYDLADDVCEIKVRGNSTLEADKLSYALRLKDSRDILGMGRGRKWVLLANAYDPTLLRNYIALETARKLRLNYTSECRYVELWINDIFMGNYLMTDPVQDGGDRVDIHPAAGDFLVEYERTREDEDKTSYIITDNGYRYLIHDPKHANESQAEYVLSVMNHVEEVIAEVQIGKMSSVSQAGIERLSAIIDIDSFVDYCVFAEFMKSVDMGFSSEYFYYKDGLLYAGPVWDYDLSAGNVNSSYYTHYSNLATTGDSAEGFWIDEQGKLLKCLMECREFRKLVWDRYRSEDVQKIFTGIYDEGGLIDETVKAYGASFDNNYGEGLWEEGKQYFAYAGTPFPTFEENVEYLKQWYKRRNEWLLQEINVD